MSMILLRIDVQKGESRKLPFHKKEWDRLLHNIATFNKDWAALGGPSMNVANVQNEIEAKQVPLIGEFAIVRAALLRRNRIDLAADADFDYRQSFVMPVGDSELTATKNSFSAGSSPLIVEHLKQNKIEHPVLIGVWEAHDPGHSVIACISSTAIDLAEKGFKPIIVSEATNGREFPKPMTDQERMGLFKDKGVEVIVAPARNVLARAKTVFSNQSTPR